MSKLLMLSGLPASGKSTKAKEIVADGNWFRVNRDCLRTMLHFDKFTGKNEGITVGCETLLAGQLLAQGYNVVVDDCNLNPENERTWKILADQTNATFEKYSMNIGWEECCFRDEERPNSVGKFVIKNMALQYGLVEKPEKGWILCDLDGTICDVSHRLHHVQKDPKDWKAFFNAIPNDTVRNDVQKMVADYHNDGYGVIFVSARPEEYREQTLQWLHYHGLGFYFTILMRRSGDTRPDTEVKQQMLNSYFPDKSVIAKVIDDRPSVIRMWRENGLEVEDVGNGIDF